MIWLASFALAVRAMLDANLSAIADAARHGAALCRNNAASWMECAVWAAFGLAAGLGGVVL